MDEPLYAHLRHPILKVLHSHGITKSSSVSINVLTDVLDKYLKSLLGSCQEYANHAGRTSLKVNDVIHSLDEMGTTLDDLRDYLEIDAGIRGQEESNPKEGIQRYAYVVGPKKEAELNEFKGDMRMNLPAQRLFLHGFIQVTRLLVTLLILYEMCRCSASVTRADMACMNSSRPCYWHVFAS
jgi:Wiskott-Aldrich syndrome protein